MGAADWQEQMQLEEERLHRTLEALHEIHNVGLEDTARFLASELGVKTWFEPQESR
jgi:hypothetical protein